MRSTSACRFCADRLGGAFVITAGIMFYAAVATVALLLGGWRTDRFCTPLCQEAVRSGVLRVRK